MCATIREVVVLPLVPVTATIGTRGRRVVGPGPRSEARTDSAAWPTSSLEVGAGRAQSSTSATAWPSAWARVRLRQGKATTIWCTSWVGRTRTASRVVPASAAIWRSSRSMARAANRCRNPLPGSPGRDRFRPTREANRSATSVGASMSWVRSSVSLIAARGKYRFGPSRTRSSTSADVIARTLSEAGQAPIAW